MNINKADKEDDVDFLSFLRSKPESSDESDPDSSWRNSNSTENHTKDTKEKDKSESSWNIFKSTDAYIKDSYKEKNNNYKSYDNQYS